jgi:hypothetical protein
MPSTRQEAVKVLGPVNMHNIGLEILDGITITSY